jgi:hypothetical protein
MSYIFERLPEDEKDLYLSIRRHLKVENVCKIIEDDWCDSSLKRIDKLIAKARIWKKKDGELVRFT